MTNYNHAYTNQDQGQSQQDRWGDSIISGEEFDAFMDQIARDNELHFGGVRSSTQAAWVNTTTGDDINSGPTACAPAEHQVSAYPSALFNADYYDSNRKDAIDNDFGIPPYALCGYVLVGGKLVPETFIRSVQNQLENLHFEYGYVLEEQDLFDEDFLHTLDESERSVLMEVVLLLARGDFNANLWASKGLGLDDDDVDE